MKIWSNTKTLDGYLNDLDTSATPENAQIALIGGKPIDLACFPKLLGIFKTGVGRDNVPEEEAQTRGIRCGFPSQDTANIIFDETASFACHLILKCLYAEMGDFAAWKKNVRTALSAQEVLVIGTGNIGSRAAKRIAQFTRVSSYDVHTHAPEALPPLIRNADCISLHIPLTDATREWFDAEKLSWMKYGASLVNTSRASIVPEEDLYRELKHERLRAAFDVFWKEPYTGKLLDVPDGRFMVSPHVASTCREFLMATARDFLDFLEIA